MPDAWHEVVVDVVRIAAAQGSYQGSCRSSFRLLLPQKLPLLLRLRRSLDRAAEHPVPSPAALAGHGMQQQGAAAVGESWSDRKVLDPQLILKPFSSIAASAVVMLLSPTSVAQAGCPGMLEQYRLVMHHHGSHMHCGRCIARVRACSDIAVRHTTRHCIPLKSAERFTLLDGIATASRVKAYHRH